MCREQNTIQRWNLHWGVCMYRRPQRGQGCFHTFRHGKHPTAAFTSSKVLEATAAALSSPALKTETR